MHQSAEYQKQPPEVFCENAVLKNFTIFTGKHLLKAFNFIKKKWYSMHLPGTLLRPGSKNEKKIHPEKNSLYFRKWNFLALKLKEFLYFLKRNLFLYFREQNPALFRPRQKNKNFSYFLEIKLFKKILYISENGTLLYFGNGIFRTLVYLELEAYSEPLVYSEP